MSTIGIQESRKQLQLSLEVFQHSPLWRKHLSRSQLGQLQYLNPRWLEPLHDEDAIPRDDDHTPKDFLEWSQEFSFSRSSKGYQPNDGHIWRTWWKIGEKHWKIMNIFFKVSEITWLVVCEDDNIWDPVRSPIQQDSIIFYLYFSLIKIHLAKTYCFSKKTIKHGVLLSFLQLLTPFR